MANPLKNKLALLLFDTIATSKGFCFREVRNETQQGDIDNMYAEEGFTFPDELSDKVRSYKVAGVNFIAYYSGEPVGMVRLADPGVINRPYELYGVDVQGEHFEIQSLLVKRNYREATQFVMLGLFRKMYGYSVKHGVTSWSSCGLRSVYLTMKRFCKKIEVEEVDFANIQHPLTQYLYTHNIIDTYFTMEVTDLEPWDILKRCIRLMLKKMRQAEIFDFKRAFYARLSYRSK